MKKLLQLVLLTILISSNGFAQKNLWQKTSVQRLNGLPLMERASMPTQYDLYTLDFNELKNQLQNAPLDFSGVQSNIIISFPNSNGQFQNFRVYEAPVVEKGLSDKFPDLKSYSAKGLEDTSATIRFSTTLFGLHVMSISGKTGTFYIDTYTKDLNNYIVYSRHNIKKSNSNFRCLVQDEAEFVESNSNNFQERLVNDGVFRQYRLAMSCTIEYAAFHVSAAGLNAGTLTQKKAAVLSAMVVTMTRVNGVYERDMSLRMNLIPNNDLIIFVDSDSFSNDNANQLINQSQSVIDASIGSANYDIGHTVSTGGGGLATPGPCSSNSKAKGITGSPSPVGDPYDIDYVAHEMGHQFGANHTFNNSCGGNRNSSTAVEPGSGTTILSYAGICSPDIQNNSDAYFHAASIAEMTTYVTGFGNSCSSNTTSGNIAPVVNAGFSYTIPRGTAFILKGSATDANNDSLTYCWEQTNNQSSTQPPVQTATTGPNFRSRPPSASPNRYMPIFSEVLAGNLTPTWEVVPNVARSMNFALTVRDNRSPLGGQTNRGNMTVTTASVGPFRITSPSVEDVSWPLDSSQTITWDVAGTTGNGINTANVNILISRDGGTTFSTLLANTPNDGTETLVISGPAAQNTRIMIEAVGNIYYALSKNIALGYTLVTTCNTYTNSTPLPIPDGLGNGVQGQAVSNIINVPFSTTISDVNISLNVTHSYPQDLIIAINNPTNAIQVPVWNNACAGNDNFNVTLSDGSPAFTCVANMTGTFSPSSPLSAFNGGNSSGDWSLITADFFNVDTGTINSWSIEICGQTATLLTEDFGFENFAIYPNPNNGNFNIQFTSKSTNEINVMVHDIRGRQIMKKVFENKSLFNENIQMDTIQKGIYLVTVSDGVNKEVKKISVE